MLLCCREAAVEECVGGRLLPAALRAPLEVGRVSAAVSHIHNLSQQAFSHKLAVLLLPCRSHLQRLCALVSEGQLAVVLDPRRFVGLGTVPSAVAHLQSGSSSGKVVVQLSDRLPDAPAAARL